VREQPFYDEKNRLVVEVLYEGSVAKYYLGDDCKGVIYQVGTDEVVYDRLGMRRWRGIINPDDVANYQAPLDFGIVLVKPDGFAEGHVAEVEKLLQESDFSIHAKRDLWLTQYMVERMYPMFYHQNYESRFFDYMTSGKSRAIIVVRDNCVNRLQEFKPRVREMFGKSGHMCNLIHCSSSTRDVTREASALFCLGQIQSLLDVGGA